MAQNSAKHFRSIVFGNKYWYKYLSTWYKRRVSRPKLCILLSVIQISQSKHPYKLSFPYDIELLYPEIFSLLFRVSHLHIRFLLTFSYICLLFHHVENSLPNNVGSQMLNQVFVLLYFNENTNNLILQSQIPCNLVNLSHFISWKNLIFWYQQEVDFAKYEIWLGWEMPLSYLVKCTSC